MPYRGDQGYPREAGRLNALGARTFDYVNDVAYVGIAPAGTSEDQPRWRITRLIFTDAGALRSRAIAQDVRWTDRYVAAYDGDEYVPGQSLNPLAAVPYVLDGGQV